MKLQHGSLLSTFQSNSFNQLASTHREMIGLEAVTTSRIRQIYGTIQVQPLEEVRGYESRDNLRSTCRALHRLQFHEAVRNECLLLILEMSEMPFLETSRQQHSSETRWGRTLACWQTDREGQGKGAVYVIEKVEVKFDISCGCDRKCGLILVNER